jgi:hypothetical protein
VRPMLAIACALTLSCAARRPVTAFQVLPGQPDYLLRSPDSEETPFPEILSRYTNLGQGWVELRPQMQLRVENAYFREGAAKHGLANFLGTEIARYRVIETGAIEEISVESRVEQRPSDQPPVQQLLSESQRRYDYHRFFYQVLVDKKANVRTAVLLGAKSAEELDELAKQLLTQPDSVCGDDSLQCTVFPEACTVSLEIQIVVNGARRTVLWGNVLADFADSHPGVKLFRNYQGHLAPVEISVRDHQAFRVPLLPGDVIKW